MHCVSDCNCGWGRLWLPQVELLRADIEALGGARTGHAQADVMIGQWVPEVMP